MPGFNTWLFRLRQCAIFAHPTCQKSLGTVFDPLIKQRRNFAAEICGVIQARKLIAFERWDGRIMQVIPWWCGMSCRHVTGPLNLRQGVYITLNTLPYCYY